jgi:hypothetical protein
VPYTTGTGAPLILLADKPVLVLHATYICFHTLVRTLPNTFPSLALASICLLLKPTSAPKSSKLSPRTHAVHEAP